LIKRGVDKRQGAKLCVETNEGRPKKFLTKTEEVAFFEIFVLTPKKVCLGKNALAHFSWVSGNQPI